MKDKIRTLFISPFADMLPSVRKIADQYANIETTVLCGNEGGGRQAALEAYAEHYDCIISRGNTAALIRQAVSVPVVEVRISLRDVLDSLAAAPELPTVVAAVGYSNVVTGMESLKPYLPFQMDVFGFDTPEQLGEIFARLRERGIHTVVGDAITYELASRAGFEAFILRSGEDSIRYAFDYVTLLRQSSNAMLEENRLLWRLVAENSESGTVVFSENRKLYYSSLTGQDTAVLRTLEERLDDFAVQNRFSLHKQIAGAVYRISAREISAGSRCCYAYFVSRRMPDTQATHKGIRYLTENMVRQSLEQSIFCTANIKRYCTAELSQAMTLRNPILIFGEVGVGKNQLAEMLYLSSCHAKDPFVFIDIPFLNHASWDFLINRDRSPLYDRGNTLFLKNIDALDNYRLSQLLSVLTDGNAARNNRILISCSARRENDALRSLAKELDLLSCRTVHMLPLRGQYEVIHATAETLLSDIRSRQGSSVGDFEPEALSELLHYSWPQNYSQLFRVVYNAAAMAGSGPITKADVSKVLTSEMCFAQGETSQSANTILDLSKPLDEINRSIARILLEQNNDNQTLTAKSLGVSRTTLWRMLREDDEGK